jgi:hypothetical protein
MPPAEFETAVSAIERPQSCVLDCTAGKNGLFFTISRYGLHDVEIFSVLLTEGAERFPVLSATNMCSFYTFCKYFRYILRLLN